MHNATLHALGCFWAVGRLLLLLAGLALMVGGGFYISLGDLTSGQKSDQGFFIAVALAGLIIFMAALIAFPTRKKRKPHDLPPFSDDDRKSW